VTALVVHGESDPIPIATAEELARLLGAPLQRIPACGHVPYVEAPALFARLLDAFLPKQS
jgi:pimeloyl-ACP methyl ester carboxylesterase